MSFKREVRIFIQDFHAFKLEIKKEISSMNRLLLGYQTLVDRLEKQNEKLMDRLMSRSLPELKSFQLQEDLGPIPAEAYRPEEDEDLAGEVVDIPESGTGT